MTVVKLTAKDRKFMKPMSKNDILTAEQKAALEAARYEEYAKDTFERLGRKIESFRKELASDMAEVIKAAESPEGNPLYYLDRRMVFEYAVRIKVYAQLHQKADEASYTQWLAAAKERAVREVLLNVSDSQSTSILANHVKAVEMQTWKQFADTWFF